MKAIFSNFGRRSNVDRRENPSESSFKPAIATATRKATRSQATFASLDVAGGGIGDAPALKNPHYTLAPADHNLPSSAWAAKLSGSLRNAPLRRKGSERCHVAAITSNFTTEPSQTATPRQPSHPPSSYRDPSQTQTRANASARGLVRRFSATSRKDTSQLAVHSHDTATSDPDQQPSAYNTGPAHSVFSPPNQATGQIERFALSERPQHADTATNSNSGMSSSVSASADITTMTSEELAMRLNELAVANADGLLTDDEYRTLRQAVFDRMMQAGNMHMATPTDGAFKGFGLPARVRGPDPAAADGQSNGHPPPSAELLAVSGGRSRSSLGHGERQASSIRSGRSTRSSGLQHVTDLFRKGDAGSRAMLTHPSRDSHPSDYESANGEVEHRVMPVRRDSEGMSSQLSSGDGHSQRALSFRTQLSSAAKSSRVSTVIRLRAGSQTRRAQAESAARDLEEAVSADRAARSLRAVSISGTGSSGLPPLSSQTLDRSPTSMRAEMAPSTMFGAEYVDKSPSEIQAEIAVVQAEGDRMLGTFSTIEETLISKQYALEPLSVRKVQDKVRGANPLGCINRLEASERDHASLHASRAPPPSSYRTPRQTHPSPDSHRYDSPLQQEKYFASPEVAALEAELTSIYTQKAAVVKRYQDRLAFLQSKLRSAAIREGLK